MSEQVSKPERWKLESLARNSMRPSLQSWAVFSLTAWGFLGLGWMAQTSEESCFCLLVASTLMGAPL